MKAKKRKKKNGQPQVDITVTWDSEGVLHEINTTVA